MADDDLTFLHGFKYASALRRKQREHDLGLSSASVSNAEKYPELLWEAFERIMRRE